MTTLIFRPSEQALKELSAQYYIGTKFKVIPYEYGIYLVHRI